MQVAVIGCGEIAQIMHIPYVLASPNAELAALVDRATERAETLATRYGVADSFETVEELVRERGGEIDAVVVCTPSHTHADVVCKTLESDVHTLVEKPLAAKPEDADRMVRAAADSDATAMVAYMKRYDPTYERLQAELATIEPVDLVTAYDVDPDHGRIIDEVYDLIEGSPPESLLAESARTRREHLETAIGTDDERLVEAFDFQLEHVCHDVNALRGLFGEVERIEYADVVADGRYMTARLTYEGGVPCVLETGDSDRKWFEEWLRLDAADGMATLEFSNAYIKNTPSELRIEGAIEERTTDVRQPSYDEPFRRELEQFFECVAGTAQVRTPFREAKRDLQLIVDLFRASREGPIDR